MSDILSACTENPRPISGICTKSNINFEVAEKYVTILHDAGVIEKSWDKDRAKPAFVWLVNHDGRLFNIVLQRILVKIG